MPFLKLDGLGLEEVCSSGLSVDALLFRYIVFDGSLKQLTTEFVGKVKRT